MGQSGYYLVRRECREFIGPMKLSEFQERLGRLEFGMQDEVSGHCGPWVILDRKDDLVKAYPEIAKALGEDLPLSWRENTGHAKVISRKDQRRDRKQKITEQKNSRSDFNEYLQSRKKQSTFRKQVALGVVFVSFLIGLAIVAKKDEAPLVADVATLATRGDVTEFLNVMGLKVIPNAGRLIKTNKSQAMWLPYLRMYAYHTSGAIDGVSTKILRGELPAAALQDCSVEGWKRKWRENAGQTVAFVQGKSLNKNPWTKLLAYDPFWIRRRAAKAWTKPRNYYEGCLMTASTAMRSFSGEPGYGSDPQDAVTAEVISAMSRRIQSQLEAISTGKSNATVDKSNFLAVLSCMESQTSVAALDACRGSLDLSFRPLTDERLGLAIIRIAAAQGQGSLDKATVSMLEGLNQKLSVEDVMSRSDVSPEVKFAGYLLGGASIDQALSKAELDYADVKFH